MNKREEKGITLITLIITVIVLAIIAGIVIRFTSEDRLIDAAKKTTNDITNQAEEHDETVNAVRNLYK